MDKLTELTDKLAIAHKNYENLLNKFLDLSEQLSLAKKRIQEKDEIIISNNIKIIDLNNKINVLKRDLKNIREKQIVNKTINYSPKETQTTIDLLTKEISALRNQIVELQKLII